MTADAITGVEEKCRSHGIWNYVSKPFEPDLLIETLISLLREKLPIAQASRVEMPEETAQIVDFQDGLKRIGGETSIYRLVLQSFAEENSNVGEELSKTIESKEYVKAEQIVHKIKSSAGSVGAKKLHDISVELQRALKEQDELESAKLSMEFFECLKKSLAAILEFIKNS